MKKIFVLLLACGVFTFFACNNESAEADEASDDVTTKEAVDAVSNDDDAGDTDADVKLIAHVCNDECADGNHNYKHGEEGHVCGDACAAMDGGDGGDALAEHVCTDACVDGNHDYKHGEKGHVCDDACAGIDGSSES